MICKMCKMLEVSLSWSTLSLWKVNVKLWKIFLVIENCDCKIPIVFAAIEIHHSFSYHFLRLYFKLSLILSILDCYSLFKIWVKSKYLRLSFSFAWGVYDLEKKIILSILTLCFIRWADKMPKILSFKRVRLLIW